jgi:hypothetical protein
VVREIEDRQMHLEQMEKIGGLQKEVQERIKKEIVDRIGEL